MAIPHGKDSRGALVVRGLINTTDVSAAQDISFRTSDLITLYGTAPRFPDDPANFNHSLMQNACLLHDVGTQRVQTFNTYVHKNLYESLSRVTYGMMPLNADTTMMWYRVNGKYYHVALAHDHSRQSVDSEPAHYCVTPAYLENLPNTTAILAFLGHSQCHLDCILLNISPQVTYQRVIFYNPTIPHAIFTTELDKPPVRSGQQYTQRRFRPDEVGHSPLAPPFELRRTRRFWYLWLPPVKGTQMRPVSVAITDLPERCLEPRQFVAMGDPGVFLPAPDLTPPNCTGADIAKDLMPIQDGVMSLMHDVLANMMACAR